MASDDPHHDGNDDGEPHVHGPHCNHGHHHHAPQVPARKVVRPGRNDACWCGSGKKYKKCHLKADGV